MRRRAFLAALAAGCAPASRPSAPDRATPAPRPSPGDGVVWSLAPALRPAPAGVTPHLADVESRLPPADGNRYRAADRATWCHETTHGVHAALRRQHGRPALYPGGGRCALVNHPAGATIADAAACVPAHLRGGRYRLYLVQQARQWGREPLYLWDEWVAYDNGTQTAIEEGGRRAFAEGPRCWPYDTQRMAGATDDAVACIEFCGYALAVGAAARKKRVALDRQFSELLAWELRRSLALYAAAMKLPSLAWPDRRLERAWRANDPWIAQELRALYGDRLTVKELLP